MEPVAPRTLAERLKDLIGTVHGGPPDWAENHDYYIHGTPNAGSPVGATSLLSIPASASSHAAWSIKSRGPYVAPAGAVPEQGKMSRVFVHHPRLSPWARLRRPCRGWEGLS